MIPLANYKENKQITKHFDDPIINSAEAVTFKFISPYFPTLNKMLKNLSNVFYK